MNRDYLMIRTSEPDIAQVMERITSDYQQRNSETRIPVGSLQARLRQRFSFDVAQKVSLDEVRVSNNLDTGYRFYPVNNDTINSKLYFTHYQSN